MSDKIDLDDEESEQATEQQMTLNWLEDLETRVTELEELCGIGPYLLHHGLETRVGDLEALTEVLLPAVYARNQRPLWTPGTELKS